MDAKSMQIVFSSNISNLVEQNSSFDSGVLRVAYTGKNRNNSFISKETFNRCLPTIFNCPIVCRYDRDTDTIGSHDMELVSNSEGMRIVNITQPVGVVPQSAKQWWEIIEDTSGVHEYLCTDVLLWKRQEAYEKIKRDGITDESMEISVKNGSMQDGVFVIDDFEFTAFCLLGTAEPCFESASLEVFSHQQFGEELAEMMREFKESFSMVQTSNKEDEICTKTEEGGNDLEEKNAIIAEFGLTVDDIEFDIESLTVDELRAKLEELTAEGNPDGGTDEGDENFALNSQIVDEIYNALSVVTIETCFGTMCRYDFIDFDPDVSEVYCYDMEDWNLYGFPYTMNGDLVEIDFACKKRKKFTISDFDEGEQTLPFAKKFEIAKEKYAEVTAQLDELNAKNESMTTELGELREFRANIESAEKQAKMDELFANFEDLNGNPAFDELRDKSSDYSLEDLEEKLYAIRGRIGNPANFSLTGNKPKLAILDQSTDKKNLPYGGLFEQYGYTPNKN